MHIYIYIYIYIYARGVMVIIVGNYQALFQKFRQLTASQIYILDEAVCISHSTSTIGKGINRPILPPGVGK